MASPFYKYTIPTFSNGLKNLTHILKEAETYAKQNNISPDELLDARLVEDMQPLAFQILTAAENVTKTLARATFVEPAARQEPAKTFEGLYKQIDAALAELEKADPVQIANNEGKVFQAPIGPLMFDYTIEDYAVKFAIPNFYFHVTTAYAILRAKGVKLGKKDFLNELVAK
jgi:hypothetical protein